MAKKREKYEGFNFMKIIGGKKYYVEQVDTDRNWIKGVVADMRKTGSKAKMVKKNNKYAAYERRN